MSLQDWANSGWVQPHRTSKEEIKGLFELADRDIADQDYEDKIKEAFRQFEIEVEDG